MDCLRGALGPPTSPSRGSGLLGFRTTASLRYINARPHTNRNMPLVGCFKNYGTSLGDLGSPIFVKGDSTRPVLARRLRAAKCSHSPFSIRVYFLSQFLRLITLPLGCDFRAHNCLFSAPNSSQTDAVLAKTAVKNLTPSLLHTSLKKANTQSTLASLSTEGCQKA
jgi:hypothetical protein